MFTTEEIIMINDALDMAIASNKRLQKTKPQYDAIFRDLDARLNAIKIKLNTPNKK